MNSKLNTAWAIAFTGWTGILTGVYVHNNTVKTNEELTQKNFERQKELIKYRYELEQMNHSNDSPERRAPGPSDWSPSPGANSMTKEALVNQLTELKDTNSSMSKLHLTSTDSVGPVTKALSELNYSNVQEPSISSVLEYISLLVTAYQHFAFSFFMFNVSIFVCLIGLVSNSAGAGHRSEPGGYYFKLYGDKYMDKLPKWSLPIARSYYKVREYSNDYYIITIFVVNIMSMMGNIILSILG
jgi:hypothetical protein